MSSPVKQNPCAATLEVQAISTSSKIADFWKDKPRLWFAHFEAVTTPQKLGDESKFHLVLTKLAKEEIEQASDIVISLSDSGKYQKLKDRLISTYEESPHRKFQRLFTDTDLGDRKPSQLLRKIKELGEGQINDETAKMFWLKQLPTSLTSILSANKEKGIDDLAQMADNIYEVSSFEQVAALSRVDDPVTQLTAELAKVKIELAAIHNNNNRRQFYRSKPFSSSRSGSPFPFRRNSKLCFYHSRFGKRAFKCEAPCSWKQQGN